ncbi:MAG: hypothetical protein IJM15_02555 [Erysipelotrichaceae bacterium]|nr:hypothetical protein [Erysipelotrichaceae bacterium]
MKKLFSLLVVAAIVLSSLAGCGEKKPKDTNIVVWVGEESAEFYQKVCN